MLAQEGLRSDYQRSYPRVGSMITDELDGKADTSSDKQGSADEGIRDWGEQKRTYPKGWRFNWLTTRFGVVLAAEKRLRKWTFAYLDRLTKSEPPQDELLPDYRPFRYSVYQRLLEDGADLVFLNHPNGLPRHEEITLEQQTKAILATEQEKDAPLYTQRVDSLLEVADPGLYEVPQASNDHDIRLDEVDSELESVHSANGFSEAKREKEKLEDEDVSADERQHADLLFTDARDLKPYDINEMSRSLDLIERQ